MTGERNSLLETVVPCGTLGGKWYWIRDMGAGWGVVERCT
jgi:hypothetical protein